MRYFCIVFSMVVITAPLASGENSASSELNQFPSLIAGIRISGPLDFCGELVQLDNPEIRERFDKELLLTIWDRPQVILWIKRSPRYLPLIQQMLKQNDMPDDLKYISIVESALRPHAGSRKGAIGFWQFMESTGRKYGLKIDSEKDERRNVHKSTQAAIAYFKDLYDKLGSWTLAAAAYNMGELGLQSEILAQKTKNFYQLYLPLETQRYIFRIHSAKLILSTPEKFGFRYQKEDLYLPLEFDRIKIECFQETPLQIVAQAAGTHFKVIKDLNPEIRGHYLAAGSHSILIPKGAAGEFQTNFKQLVDQWLAQKEERVYVVKEGDNLSTIAERFNVPLPALIIWNRLEKRNNIYPGDRLVIYSDEIGANEDN
ncbi:MAG: transglycosylase SLT domain-containing protein [Desulfobacterales bacterium]|nr:MAG: transglycosylase SLT domain-containing protein [Desulfobacterales bacterium]